MSLDKFRPLITGEGVDVIENMVKDAFMDLEQAAIVKLARDIAEYINKPQDINGIPDDYKQIMALMYTPSLSEALVNKAAVEISYENIRLCLLECLNDFFKNAKVRFKIDSKIFDSVPFYSKNHKEILHKAQEAPLNDHELVEIMGDAPHAQAARADADVEEKEKIEEGPEDSDAEPLNDGEEEQQEAFEAAAAAPVARVARKVEAGSYDIRQDPFTIKEILRYAGIDVEGKPNDELLAEFDNMFGAKQDLDVPREDIRQDEADEDEPAPEAQGDVVVNRDGFGVGDYQRAIEGSFEEAPDQVNIWDLNQLRATLTDMFYDVNGMNINQMQDLYKLHMALLGADGEQ